MPFTPRGNERTNSNIPEGQATGDMPAWRHGGDGIAAPITAARIQGYYPVGTSYVDVQVDVNGVLQTAGGGGGGAVTIADGADVAQGTTTDVAWVAGAGTVISLLKKIASAGGSAVSIADGADVAEGTTTDAAYAGGATATTISALKGIYGKVSGTLTVTGPLTDTQLRASAVPVSLASVPSHAVTNVGVFAVQDSQKLADNTGFTDGTTPLQPAGFIYDEIAGTALTENDIAAARLNLNRAQIGVLEDGVTRGRWATVTATNALKVDGSAVTQPVSGTFFQATQPVSIAAVVPVSDNAGSLTVDAPVATPVFVRLSDGAAAIATLPVSAASLPLPAGAATSALQTQPGVDIGDVTVNNAAGAAAVNIQDGGNSITVDGSVTALDEDSATGTHANIVGTGASQTIVASNANRKGATIFNDSAVVCYVKFGATASATSFLVKMVDQSYFEVPFKYTGVIDAFWASGTIRVVELT